MRSLRPAVLCLASALLVVLAPAAFPQSESRYVRNNSFGVLFAYSNDSSHILFGEAEERKLLNIGVSYSRKLLAGRIVNWQYDAEILPVALESDPLTRSVNVQTSPTQQTFMADGLQPMIQCAAFIYTYSYTINDVTYAGTDTYTCQGRQWSMGASIAPAGLQFNFLPRHKLQPVIESHGGYMFSSRQIPVTLAGSFNFTVDAGVGVEYFRTHRQSFRAEYRYHHTSNHDTALMNPGIDNSVFQIAYLFGR